MSTVAERPGGRTWGKDGGKVEYLVLGETSAAAARAAVLAVAPSPVSGWSIGDCQANEIEGVDGGAFDVTVPYINGDSSGEGKETGESTFQFDTTGGTTHITTARQHIADYGEADSLTGEPPNHHGAIGVSDRGVDGTDVVIPVYKFEETHYIADVNVDNAYKQALFLATGRVNTGSFKGFSTGECLFLGARGSKRGKGDWEITFSFAASPNLTSFSIGEIVVDSAEGWFHVWVEFEQSVDETAKRNISKPIAAHVERVYDYADMSTLEIGT